MATARHPGAGRGRGGGRPARGEFVRLNLHLSPRAAEVLRAAGKAQGLPVWQVVERLVQDAFPVPPEPAAPAAPERSLPPSVLQIAQEAADFLDYAWCQPADAQLLQCWKHALAMARHEDELEASQKPMMDT